MHELEMWKQRIVHVLPEQRIRTEAVQDNAVGELVNVEGGLLRQNVIEMRG